MSAFTSRRISLRAVLLLLSAVVLVILPLSGCYTLDNQVIPPQLGVASPYTSSPTAMDGGQTLYISSAGYYNDYNYRVDDKNGTTTNQGTFRLINISGDVYAVQFTESDNSVDLIFYHINPSTFHDTDFADPNAAQNLASQYNVKLDLANSAIAGTPSNVLAFLQASSSLAFK